MGCKTGPYNKTSTPECIFIVRPSPEGWLSKAKEAPFPHELRLDVLYTNPVFDQPSYRIHYSLLKVWATH